MIFFFTPNYIRTICVRVARTRNIRINGFFFLIWCHTARALISARTANIYRCRFVRSFLFFYLHFFYDALQFIIIIFVS